MDPAEALTDLKQISTQVERAVVVRNDGTLEASTLRDAAAAERIGRGAADLWEAAEAARVVARVARRCRSSRWRRPTGACSRSATTRAWSAP